MWYLWVFRLWNCKCRKKLVDKLVEKCAKNVEEVNLATITLTLFRIVFFGAAHGRLGVQKCPLSKICHIYPTLIKLGAIVPYLKKNAHFFIENQQLLVYQEMQV